MLQTLLAPAHSKEKQKLLRAIERNGPTVTPDVISVETGLPILETIRLLNVVASETNAHLTVSSSGSISYSFAPSFGNAYVFDFTKNLLYAHGKFAVKLSKIIIRLAVGITIAVARIVFGILWFLFRISFGLILAGSIAMIVIGLFTLLSNIDGVGDALGDIGGDVAGLGAEAGTNIAGATLEKTIFNANFNDCLVQLFRCFDVLYYLDFTTPFHSAYSYEYSSYRSTYADDAYGAGYAAGAAVSYTTAQQLDKQKQSDFLMDFFSYLFGDGDANSDMEEKQWRCIGQVIEKNNGVVIAEQIAPYICKPAPGEDWMIPILVHFNGLPDVSEDGNIVYIFPSFVKDTFIVDQTPSENPTQIKNSAEGEASLAVSSTDIEQLRNLYRSHLSRQSTSTTSRGAKQRSSHLPNYLREREWVFSLADSKMINLFHFLVFANLLGSSWLFVASNSTRMLMSLHSAATYMLAFAVATVVVPLGRAIAIWVLNSKVDRRNKQRMEGANRILKREPGLMQKLNDAKAAERALTTGSRSAVVYSTQYDDLEQHFAASVS